jgi:hypothetical protein
VPRAEALAAYAADVERPPVLREIATLAIARRFTQESLAKAWRDRGWGIGGGNVKRHFDTKAPHEDTVRRYADVLGVNPEYLLLLHSHKFEDANAVREQHHDPAGASERYWLRMMELRLQSNEWQSGTDEVVATYLQRLNQGERRRYLEVFALAWYRDEYLGESFFPGRAALAAFEAIAPPELELAKRRRELVPGETRFLDLWTALRDVVDPDEFEVVLAVVRTMHKKHAIDVTPMDNVLNEDDLYRQWRETYARSQERMEQ